MKSKYLAEAFYCQKKICSDLCGNVQLRKRVIRLGLQRNEPEAAGICKEKVQEICQKIPAFRREIDWRRGKTQEGKDYCKYIFKNGSYFDNVAARESSRGKRRQGGLIEECVGVDGDILNTVLIPQMGAL